MDDAARETLDAFVRSRHHELLRFGLVLTGRKESAEDLVQDALERTGLAWSRLARQEDPEGYVRRVMVNRHISAWRRPHREIPTQHVPDQSTAEAPQVDHDLWRLLERLPRKQRAVVVLRYYEDLSEADIARVLQCSPGTVKSQASKALAKLRAGVQAHADGATS